tara:strand:- start:2276 stop:3541 length:1266 start_codon:yes stop_codon:yes gene_type:complete
MKIAILGNGGREHAITFSISKSKKVKKIFCIPGNAGTSEIAENIQLDINNFQEIYSFLKKNTIDLVVVGPEQPLVDGIVDFLENKGIKVFGPDKISSQLEGSKIFTKNLCKKFNIPTADYGVFKNNKEANKFINLSSHPLVIKADNLASGKGVYICQNKNESEIAINEIFGGKFGIAEKVLIEEFLEGEEMSFFIITDGKTIKNFGTAQDHKRVGEGDQGKNTGGMGAYSPSRLINDELEKKILERIIKPTLNGLTELGNTYKGFLYAGLMIKNNEPFLIEYNVRMGDPECQIILPKLKSDLIALMLTCIEGKLSDFEIDWSDKKTLCVVLCSNGYPDNYEKDIVIDNLGKLNIDDNNFIFHAGTVKNKDQILSIGGRVLNFISISDDFSLARKNIHKNLEKLGWDKGFYRKDIGFKVINK